MTPGRIACGVLVLLSILGAPLFLVAQDDNVAPQPLALAGASSHVYKSVQGTELRLHVFAPSRPDEAVTPRAAIVFFFGGAWTMGTLEQFVPQATHLARRGMVAIVADYRVFARHGTGAFEAIADAKSAIRWTRAHARELGIDPNRIAAGGGSAGGHIAAAAALLDRFDDAREDLGVSSRPDALVLFNPALDTGSDDRSRLNERALQSIAARFGDRGREGSPLHHLDRGLPPTMILHGKADTTVPYADAARFCADALERGNQCRLVGYEGATHGFFNPQNAGGSWYRQTLLEADRFLTQLGYLPSPPPTEIIGP